MLGILPLRVHWERTRPPNSNTEHSCPLPSTLKAPIILFRSQASGKAMTEEEERLALVIIMLSALEVQVSWVFFGVFNYLEMIKRSVTAEL